jgi:O-antigen/teichoic acid export membrane protein
MSIRDRFAVQLKGSAIRSILYASASRIIVMLIGFVATALASRIVFEESGAGLFGLVMVVATLQAVMPFADLGLGAVVMNTVAKENLRAPALVDAQLGRVFRILLAVAGALAIITLIASFTGMFQWFFSGLVPFTASVNMWTTVAVMAVATSIPLGIGYRVLVGLNQTHVAVLASAAAPIAVGMSIVVIRGADLPLDTFIAVWPLSALIANLLTLILASRRLGRGFRPFFKMNKRRMALPGLLATSTAMLTISIATPLAYQSHRIILAQVGSPGDLAQYAMGAQLYGPLLSVLTIAATPLWPRFAATPNQSARRQLWRRSTLLFGAFGLAVAAVFLVCAPIYIRYVSGTWHYVPWSALWLFAALLVLNALIYPTLMRMNEGIEIRWQSLCAVLAALVSIPLSIVLARAIGAEGPLIAALASLLVVQLLPLWAYVNRVPHRAINRKELQCP